MSRLKCGVLPTEDIFEGTSLQGRVLPGFLTYITVTWLFHMAHTCLVSKKLGSDKKKSRAYITNLNAVKRSYPGLISSFIYIFCLLMFFRHLGTTQENLQLFFEYMGHAFFFHCSILISWSCLWGKNSDHFHCLWRPLLYNTSRKPSVVFRIYGTHTHFSEFDFSFIAPY